MGFLFQWRLQADISSKDWQGTRKRVSHPYWVLKVKLLVEMELWDEFLYGFRFVRFSFFNFHIYLFYFINELFPHKLSQMLIFQIKILFRNSHPPWENV